MLWTDREWREAIQQAYRALDPLTVVKDLRVERGSVTRALAQISTLCDQVEREMTTMPPPALELMSLRAVTAELRVVAGDAKAAADDGHDHPAPHALVSAMLAVIRGIRRLEAQSPQIIAEFAAACISGNAGSR